jgi:hypothetical protein
MQSSWNGPWICWGDFNEVLSRDEYLEPRDRSDAQLLAFRDCLQDCDLGDLGYDGPKYTWTNRLEANSNIRVRLDRAIANGDFINLYEDCNVENIITTSSDHYAILITLAKDFRRQANHSVSQGFWYEAMWQKATGYMEALESAWSARSDDSCNGPEKSPLLEIACYLLFHASFTSCIIMHLSLCMFL